MAFLPCGLVYSWVSYTRPDELNYPAWQAIILMKGSGSMVPWKQWGSGFEKDCIRQMENACSLPVSIRGALMPDAHTGYGLPIGGVLATKNAVIPYAVGMDIACRMKMSVLDLPIEAIRKRQEFLCEALEQETCCGVGACYKNRKQHRVMDMDWSTGPVTRRLKDKAWEQLGTSGSGNHFVEFGILTVDQDDLKLKTGTYLALLSHSGSRGTGAEICTHYSRLAGKMHPELTGSMSHLAWLDMDSHEGHEYWEAMQLMGHYAKANHELIHEAVVRHLDANVLQDIENHHNFAWQENHFGENVVIHRKGATPADNNAVGIIPGSMTDPGFIVRGKGNKDSMNSAAHGAGRKMSRKAAKKQYSWTDLDQVLARKGVKLLSADLDEVPMSYKNIEMVMNAQTDLVRIIARFDPKIVKMARPERGNKR